MGGPDAQRERLQAGIAQRAVQAGIAQRGRVRVGVGGSVDGVIESWSMFDGMVPRERYMAQLGGFTAARFDADAWARLFTRAGARYAVLTAKHHDTQVSDLSVVRRTPAARDLVAEYVTALRAHDLRVGLYFSHLDWSHPDYATVRPVTTTVAEHPMSMPPPGQEDPDRWERFLRFHRAQLRELVTGFQPTCSGSTASGNATSGSGGCVSCARSSWPCGPSWC